MAQDESDWLCVLNLKKFIVLIGPMLVNHSKFYAPFSDVTLYRNMALWRGAVRL